MYTVVHSHCFFPSDLTELPYIKSCLSLSGSALAKKKQPSTAPATSKRKNTHPLKGTILVDFSW